uniref:Uncharacterized protein n=1 Tax=Ditylenchus dipsaci TaxID=166011 RepID=A0A915EU39_9BILA
MTSLEQFRGYVVMKGKSIATRTFGEIKAMLVMLVFLLVRRGRLSAYHRGRRGPVSIKDAYVGLTYCVNPERFSISDYSKVDTQTAQAQADMILLYREGVVDSANKCYAAARRLKVWSKQRDSSTFFLVDKVRVVRRYLENRQIKYPMDQVENTNRPSSRNSSRSTAHVAKLASMPTEHWNSVADVLKLFNKGKRSHKKKVGVPEDYSKAYKLDNHLDLHSVLSSLAEKDVKSVELELKDVCPDLLPAKAFDRTTKKEVEVVQFNYNAIIEYLSSSSLIVGWKTGKRFCHLITELKIQDTGCALRYLCTADVMAIVFWLF